MKIPDSGLRGLFADRRLFVTNFQMCTAVAMAQRGFQAEVDPRRVDRAHALWRNKAGRWSKDLPERPDTRGREPTISDLKLFGSLLWALNKCQPVSAVYPISDYFRDELRTKGYKVADAHVEDSLFITFHNEAPIFTYVYFLYCTFEARRPESKRVDFLKAVSTRHFKSNLCYMLREYSPGAYELYMIFKAFDLYGIDHPANA